MKRLFYTLVINFPDRWETNQEFNFPYVPAIEGKTIVGINTYTDNPIVTTNAFNNNLLAQEPDLSFIFVNFANKENRLILQDYPYNALKNTGVFSSNGQDRSIKQNFAFTFSSKFSYVVNKSTIPLIFPGYSLQFTFEYLA